MAYLVLQEGGHNLVVNDTPVLIAYEWVEQMVKKHKGVSALHARISKEKEFYYIEPLAGQTVVNGVVVSAKTRIEHNSVMIFGEIKGGMVVIFKDEEQRQRKLDTQRIKAMGFNVASNRSKAIQLSREFFGNVPRTLKLFARYFLSFLEKNFRVQRVALYKVDNKT